LSVASTLVWDHSGSPGKQPVPILLDLFFMNDICSRMHFKFINSLTPLLN
jgi:hypothetical protein